MAELDGAITFLWPYKSIIAVFCIIARVEPKANLEISLDIHVSLALE